jgi:hypothetical protein
MKKIFFNILVFISNILISSDSNNGVSFRVTRGYYNYASIESLYKFIPELIHWSETESEKYVLKTVNTQDTKELCILIFKEGIDKPIRILYTVNNTNRDPKFTEMSIWDYAGSTTRKEIDRIFTHEKQNCNLTAQRHLSQLQRTIHCQNNNSAYFIPQTISRIEQQRNDGFTTDDEILRLQQFIRKRKNPLLQPTAQRRQRIENESEDKQELENKSVQEIRIYNPQRPSVSPFSNLSKSSSPSPNNPCEEL